MREIANRLASIYIDVPVLRPGTIGAYLLAFVSVGVATALRLAIDPYVEGVQFATWAYDGMARQESWKGAAPRARFRTAAVGRSG